MGLHSFGATERCCISGGKEGLYLQVKPSGTGAAQQVYGRVKMRQLNDEELKTRDILEGLDRGPSVALFFAGSSDLKTKEQGGEGKGGHTLVLACVCDDCSGPAGQRAPNSNVEQAARASP